MLLVERWWNGRWGRLARRDLWLQRDADRWLVQVRHGDVDSPVRTWPFDDEASARRWLARAMETGGDGWRRLSGGAGA